MHASPSTSGELHGLAPARQPVAPLPRPRAWRRSSAAAAAARPRSPASAVRTARLAESAEAGRRLERRAPVRSSVSVRTPEPRGGEVRLGLPLDERARAAWPAPPAAPAGRWRTDRACRCGPPTGSRATRRTRCTTSCEVARRACRPAPRRSALLLARGSRFSSSSILAACSRPRSSSKWSSGTVRVVSVLATLRAQEPGGAPQPLERALPVGVVAGHAHHDASRARDRW